MGRNRHFSCTSTSLLLVSGLQNMKSTLELFFYVSCFSYKLPCTDGDYITEMLYDACPYNNFCSGRNTSLPKGYYSCCAECSCVDDCSAHGKCCPDSGINNSNTLRTCRPQSEYFDMHRENVFLDTGYGQSYYIVDTCQHGHAINGCLHPRTLEEHILVSDPNSTVIYKNGKCAKCNGIQTYDTWNLIIFCKYDEAIADFYEREAYILDRCSLVSEPPDHLKEAVQSLQCSPHKVSTCNETGKWDFYDKQLETACKSLDMEYIEEIVIGSVVRPLLTYANVFCYMCNMKKGTSAQPICKTKNKGVDWVKDSYYGLAPLTAVFDSRKKPITKGRKCRVNEIEEPLLGICAQLFCPFGKTAVFGKCIDDLQYIYVTLNVLFKVVFISLDSHDSRSELNGELAYAFLKEMRHKINAASCGFCGATLLADSVLDIRVVQTDHCTISKLLRVLEYFSKISVFSVSLNNKRHDVQLQHTLGINVDRHPSNERNLGGVKCNEGVMLKPKFYCKRLLYTVRELVIGGMKNKTIEDLIKLSDLHDDSTAASNEPKYVICLKDYILLQNKAPSFPTTPCLSISVAIVWSKYFLL